MILKWKDWSGASHLIEGVEEVYGYPRQLHVDEARTVAEHRDGEGTRLELRGGLDVFHQSLTDAEEQGHRFNREPVESPTGQSAAPPSTVWSTIPWDIDQSDPAHAPAGSSAVWVADSVHVDRVFRVDQGQRSYGIYIAATVAHRDGSGRRRRHLFIDTAGPVYLMSETGSTVDRFSVGED